MQENIEQRCTIKFCVKFNKSTTETFASLTKAYGAATLYRTMVFKWHKAFKEGWENVEDDARSGRPISATNNQNVEVVRAVMAKDRRLSVRMFAEETGLNKNAVHRILKEHLHMRKKFVQNWCRKTCLWSKKRTGWKFVRICWEDSKLSLLGGGGTSFMPSLCICLHDKPATMNVILFVHLPCFSCCFLKQRWQSSWYTCCIYAQVAKIEQRESQQSGENSRIWSDSSASCCDTNNCVHTLSCADCTKWRGVTTRCSVATQHGYQHDLLTIICYFSHCHT